jgi:hypothetical protein
MPVSFGGELKGQPARDHYKTVMQARPFLSSGAAKIAFVNHSYNGAFHENTRLHRCLLPRACHSIAVGIALCRHATKPTPAQRARAACAIIPTGDPGKKPV